MGLINCRRISSFLTIKLMILAVCAVSLILIVVNQERLKLKNKSIWIITAPERTKENNASDQMIIEIQKNLTKDLPWFFSNGKILPEKSLDRPKVFPEDDDGDRIINQLMYIPSDYKGNKSSMKIIFDRSRVYPFRDNPFTGCPVDRCEIVLQARAKEIHAVLFKGTSAENMLLQQHQVGILYNIECPYHSNEERSWTGINWTATYRSDSELVAPYERWAYYNPNVTQILQSRDYAASKSKKVAWFVSNCFANNDRLQYAQELSKHIEVDIYGACGPLRCPRNKHKQCLQLLGRDYKFYLAFENSNCLEYITEKFFVNGLGANVLPIVMGAMREDYLLSAPANSYLHVDDFDNPKELAYYLHRLDQDDELYNSYFRWKGTGEFINTFFWCRLCAMLHGSSKPRSHTNFQRWWNGKEVCRSNSWRNS